MADANSDPSSGPESEVSVVSYKINARACRLGHCQLIQTNQNGENFEAFFQCSKNAQLNFAHTWFTNNEIEKQ